MQNKLLTIFSPPNDQFAASLQAAVMEHGKMRILQISLNSWKRLNSRKSFNSWTRQSLNSWKREKEKNYSCPLANPHS